MLSQRLQASTTAAAMQGLRALVARLAAVFALACVGAAAQAATITDPALSDKDATRDAIAATLGYRAVVAVPKAAEAVITVVEYYNAGLQHYFITAEPAEIANLDGGAFGGVWKRTGQTFNAWALAGKPADAVPVCRFFGTDQYRADGTRIGPNSHFYTADPAECAFVKTGYQSVAADGRSYPAWTYEADAFAVKLPVGGVCPGGTVPLYRAYNDGARGDPNHRYSTNPALLTALTGWSFEGLVMCVPANVAPPAPFDVRGEIRGCDNTSCQPPVSGGAAVGLVDLVIEIGNTAATPITVTIPAGFTFVSSTGTYQDGLLLDSLIVQVPAAGSTRLLLSLYCMQLSRSAAHPTAVYVTNAVTTNPGLLAIINLPRPLAIVNGSVQASVTQFAVWEVTDGKGPLSAAQLAQLRDIYAMSETDPNFPKAVADFLDTLSVVKPG
ncbi:MAG: hypothetical protein ABI831_27740 [Betaproteobacteria bacterium]